MNGNSNYNGLSESGQGPARIIITGHALNGDCHWWYLV